MGLSGVHDALLALLALLEMLLLQDAQNHPCLLQQQ
jgi:hypothetical protein